MVRKGPPQMFHVEHLPDRPISPASKHAKLFHVEHFRSNRAYPKITQVPRGIFLKAGNSLSGEEILPQAVNIYRVASIFKGHLTDAPS
jgi:hypothetical protein